MMKFTIACVAVAAFAAPAFAEAPDGSFVFKATQDYTKIENLVGEYSAQIIQNGQFVSGNCVIAELTRRLPPVHGPTLVQGLQAAKAGDAISDHGPTWV